MTCEEVRELLSSYIDGELTSDTQRVVEEHVASCDSCKTELAGLRLTIQLVRSLEEVEVPEGFRAGLMAKVRAEATARQAGLFAHLSGLLSTGPRRALAFAAIALVLVVGVNSVMGTLPGVYGAFVNLKTASPQVAGRAVADSAQTGTKAQARLEAAISPAAPVPAPAASPGGGMAQSSMSSIAPKPPMPGPVPPYGGSTTYDATQVMERQIIRRAGLQVEAPQDKFDDASRQVLFMVETFGGYVQDSSTFTDGDQKRTANFSLRIPEPNFTKALAQLESLGKVQSRSLGTQDVTDQFIDLDAQISNKEKQESRLLDLLSKAKTVEEIIRIESELNRFRTEIDSAKGRLRYLKNSVAMSSLNLVLREFRVQPDPSKPDLFRDAWNALVRSARNIVIFLGSIVPYLVVGWFVWFLFVTYKKK